MNSMKRCPNTKRRRHTFSTSRIHIAFSRLVVFFVAISSGGLRDASAAAQPSDTKPREPIVQVGHPRHIQHIVFSPDKQVFLTSARRVLLWDAVSGDKLRTFPPDAGRLKPQFALGGQVVVIGGNVWDRHSGVCRVKIVGDDQTPVGFRVATDGDRLIVGTQGGEIRSVDLKTGKTVAALSVSTLGAQQGSSDTSAETAAARRNLRIMAVGFNAENVPLALLSNDRDRVTVWNVATKREQIGFTPEYVYSGELSPDGRYVVIRHDDTNDSSETAEIYDAATGWQITQWTSTVVSWRDLAPVVFLPKRPLCLSRTSKSRVTLWNLKTGQPVREFDGHTERIDTFRLLDDGKTLETRSRDVARRWNVDTRELLATIASPKAPDRPDAWRRRQPDFPAVVPSPDGTTFLCGERLYETATGELRHALPPLMSIRERMSPHAGSIWITQAAYTPDGKHAILAWRDRYDWSQAAMFDVATGKAVRRLAVQRPDDDRSLSFSPDGRRAITRPDGVYRLWDVPHGRPLQTIGRAAPNTIYPLPQIAFSPNGRFVYTHRAPFGVFFFDAETGRPWKHDPPGQAAPNKRGLIDGKKHSSYYAGRSMVSPDGRLAASWHREPEDRQQQMVLWDLNRGEVVHTLDHAPHVPVSPHFSPDGRYLAVACSRADGRIVMWDVKSGRRLYTLSPPKVKDAWGFPTVWYLPDGKRMLVNSGSKELALHEVATGALIRRMIDTRPAPEHQRPRRLRLVLLLSPAGRYALADYDSRYAIVWDLQSGQQRLFIERDMGHILVTDYFRFRDDERQLLTRYRPATIWDLESGESKVYEDRSKLPDLTAFGVMPPQLPQGPLQRTAVAREILDKFKDQLPETVRDVEQTADGRRLIMHHDDGGMAFWDIATGRPLYRCYRFHNDSRWLTVMPDGRCFGNLEYVRYRPGEKRGTGYFSGPGKK